jgi:hypothetical protein
MKINELDRCLKGKLHLEQSDPARHADYRLRCSGKIIGLPMLLRVSHGSGELANNNLHGIAKALGLNEHLLKEMVGCRIGRACVLLCLSSKLLEFVEHQRQEQGEVFRPGVLAMLESIKLLLAEPEFAQPITWTGTERKALERSLTTVEGLSSDKDFGLVAKKLITRMSVV